LIVLDFETSTALLQLVKNGRTTRATVTVYDRATRLARFVDVLNPAEADKRVRFVDRLAAACGEEWRAEIADRLADAAIEIARREATPGADDEPRGRALAFLSRSGALAARRIRCGATGGVSAVGATLCVAVRPRGRCGRALVCRDVARGRGHLCRPARDRVRNKALR
jgi:hypothetical protein